jgi:hypothetical protein
VRQYVLPVLTALAILAVGGAGLAASGPIMNIPSRTFTLEGHDRIIAEAPGCYASCTAAGRGRTCTVREMDCKVVCATLNECKPDGIRPMQVCAIVRERP